MKKDIVIIGGGVVGCAVARLLSAYEADIAVLERGHDVAEGASKANSGIVHAGFDATPGSLKARLNVLGARMYPELCKELQVPYGRPGALVVAFDPEGEATLRRLKEQGEANGVSGLALVDGEEARALEPGLNPAVVGALHVATSGITSPYELTYALADHAALNGVAFLRNTEVETIQKTEGGFVLHVGEGREPIQARVVINCAGIDAARLHNQISETKLETSPRKGEYYVLDHVQPLPFTKTIFQTPTKMGKGVLVSPTVHGNLLLGPSAQDVDSLWDVGTTAEALGAVLDAARLTWPAESLRTVITTFAGIRTHEKGDDFVVGAVGGAPGAYEAVGIESPGLTAAPAIAELLCEMVLADSPLKPKKDWKPYPRMEKPFASMTLQERVEAAKQNPQQGNLVCRCEQVTEAEIRAAIRRPVGATSIDGVKRRVRAGMGRCQGGFCSPRVLEILAEELDMSPLAVTKCGGDSRLLVGSLQDARKGDA